MYSKVYVAAFIIIFLAIVFSPYYYNITAAEFETKLPELAKPEGDHCIEDADWMEANHMDLLFEMRTKTIREPGGRYYESKTYPGEIYEGTTHQCFECHTSKADFCDKCHEYNGVKPYCWECHNTPEILEEYGKSFEK